MQVLDKRNCCIYLYEVESCDGFERMGSFSESCLTAAVDEHKPTSLSEAACLFLALQQGVGKDRGRSHFLQPYKSSQYICELKLGERRG